MSRTMPAGPDTIAFETRGPGGEAVPRSELRLSPAFLERWALGAKLGAGAMGVVYRATERATGKVVAIKFLTRIDDEVTLRRFVAEGRAMSAVSDSHVMRVFALEVEDGHPCLVTEYLPGGTLRELMDRKGALAADEAARILGEVLAGLDACHQRGIVHRDVKPDNVMFDAHGRAVLGDLGIAKQYGDNQSATAAGMIIGTPLYMSPEQVRGEPVGIGSDIYSAGVLGHAMLAGRPPFDGTLIEIFEAHESAEPPPLPAAVPESLRAAIKKAMSKAVSDRPQNAADLRRLVAPAVAAKAPPSKLTSSKTGMPRPPAPDAPAPVSAPTELPWWSLPVAFLLAMSVGGGLASLRQRPADPVRLNQAGLKPLPAAPKMQVQHVVLDKGAGLEERLSACATADDARELLTRALPDLSPATAAPMLRRLWIAAVDRKRGDVFLAGLVAQEHEESVGALCVVAVGAREVAGLTREQAAARLREFITTHTRSPEYATDGRARAIELGPVVYRLERVLDPDCDPARGHSGLLVHALEWLGELPERLLIGNGSTREAWKTKRDTKLPGMDDTWVFTGITQVEKAGFRMRAP